MNRPRTDLIIIHCSLDLPDSTIGFKEIDRRHRAEQKFGCGYHAIIRRDGSVDSGRHLESSGLHTRGYNDRSVGVCLIGGRNQAGDPYPDFTAAQIDALRGLLETLLKSYPDAEVYGRAELDESAEDSPGFKVKEWLDTGEVIPYLDLDKQEGTMTDE